MIPNFFRKMIWAFQDDVAPFEYWKNNLGIVPDTVVEKIIHKLVSEYMSLVKSDLLLAFNDFCGYNMCPKPL